MVIPFLSLILISILAFYHKYAKITAWVLKPGRLLSYFFLQRQNLIEAFWRLLAKKDLNRITIKEITDLAGYNRGTFYQYFTDIYALIDGEEERVINAIRELNAPKIAMESPEQLPTVVMPFIQQNKQQIALLLAKRGNIFLDKLKSEMYPFFLHSYNITDSPAAQIMFAFVIGGITHALIEWQTNHDDLTIDRLAPFIVSCLLHGPLPVLLEMEHPAG